MGVRSFLAATILLLSGAWTLVATAQQRAAPPSRQHSTLRAQSAVEKATLPPVDVPALKAKDKAQSGKIRPYRYGTVVETDYRPEEDGTWEQLPSGDWIWRFRLQSKNAVSISLGFTRFQLPDDASLFVYDPNGELIRGPYTQADATNNQHWTPLVRGEEIVIELKVPASQREAVNLVLGKVVHGYQSLFPDRSSTTAKAGSCNLDIACDQSVGWRDQVRSVALYAYTTPGGSAFVCTGSLVNNTTGDETPYFLTAEHCVTGPSVANSMRFYWNYQNATCRRRGTGSNGPNAQVTNDDPTDQTSSGAILRARYGNEHVNDDIAGKPDLALVEVDDQIPDSYELYFNGWSIEGAEPPKSVTIHHPSGDGKRISFDQDPATITGFGQSSSGNTHLRIGNWETGTTEGGSSGGPLYNPDRRVVGVLSGGNAGCDGGIGDNNRPDWYGRLAAGFNKGDYTPPSKSSPTTPADFLDPNDTGTTTLDGKNLSSNPPGAISDLRVSNITPDSLTLQWTAPGGDGNVGTALVYDLRFRSEGPINSTGDFLAARQLSNLPSPKPSGTRQSATVAVNRDTSFHFALKSYDEAYQSSPLARSNRAVTLVSDIRITKSPYPNPTDDQAKFGLAVAEAQTVRAILYDLLGRRVRTAFRRDVSSNFDTQIETIDLSGLSSGIYFLRLRGKSVSETRKIVVVE